MGSQAPYSPSKFTENLFTSCASSVTVPGGPQHTVRLWSPKERKLGKIVSIFYLKGHLNHFFVLFTHSKETTNVLDTSRTLSLTRSHKFEFKIFKIFTSSCYKSPTLLTQCILLSSIFFQVRLHTCTLQLQTKVHLYFLY